MLGSSSSWLEALGSGGVFVVGLSALLTVLLVVLVAMCACKEKPGQQQAQLKQVTPTNGRREQDTDEVRPASPEEVTVITVPDPADNKRVSSNSSGSRNSNGILVMGQAAGSSGGNRPESMVKSHFRSNSGTVPDRRLPEIPPPLSNIPPQTSMDDEEPDENYDVIPTRKSAPPTTQREPEDEMDDGTYDVISDVKKKSQQARFSAPGYSTMNDPPYSMVKDAIDPPYCNIVNKAAASDTPDGATGEEPPYNVVCDSLENIAQAPEYASVAPPPPVPEKCFEDENLAPPLEGTTVGDSQDISSPTSSGSAGAVGGGGANHQVTIDLNPATTSDAPPAQKREPPYSKVTARESLAHMRARQAEIKAANIDTGEQDRYYASVNYEQIKRSESDKDNNLQQGDNVSELYAEIGSVDGVSLRSSTYARIGDVGNAPTPPPVEILKRISYEIKDDGDESGYSRIIKSRSTGAAPSERFGEEDHAPTYAQVDLAKKTPRRGAETKQNNYDNININVNSPSHENGARPKVVRVDLGSRSLSSALDHHKYENIPINSAVMRTMPEGAEPNYQSLHETDSETGEKDPGYETVPGPPPVHNGYGGERPAATEEEDNDADPNYERVPAGGAAQGSHGAAERGDGAAAGGRQRRPIREHVYQDIDEARKNKRDNGPSTEL